MDLEQARYNMIEQQIRPWDVLDQRVLNALASVPRERYVPEAYRALAYTDTRIPIGHGQVMMNPNVEGRLLQVLQITAGDRALEIGTGSGYITACLSVLAASVESVEIYPELSQAAGGKLQRDGLSNVSLHVGDAATGWGEPGVYDVIAITGSLSRVPDHYRQSLRTGGRLFVVRGSKRQPIMEAMLVTRVSDDNWVSDSLFETELAPLVNSTPAAEFVF